MNIANRKNIFQKLPEKEEIQSFFLTASAVINFWSMIAFLYSLPSLLSQMTLQEISSILSIFFTVSFVETISITAFMTALAWILPKKWLSENFHIHSFILLIFFLLFVLPSYLLRSPVSKIIINLLSNYNIFIWRIIVLLSIILYLIRKNKLNNKDIQVLHNIISRISILGGLFIVLDLMAVLYIILQKVI